MNYELFRDFSSLQFIRVQKKLPCASYYAGGAGFSVSQALKRCESEWIERSFELLELRPKNIVPAGIAAHFTQREAQQRAYWEAIESFLVSQMISTQTLPGVALANRTHFKWWLSRIEGGYFSVIISQLSGTSVVTHSYRPTLIATLLKVWEEHRNPYFFRPSRKALQSYSKAMKLLGPGGADKLRLHWTVTKQRAPNLTEFLVTNEKRADRHIVYLLNKPKEGSE